MGELFQFVPRAELDATENLQGFITSCRDVLKVFGADLDWDSNTWDVSKYITHRGRNGRLAFVFTNYDTSGEKQGVEPMAQPFLDFAKAYMRFQHVRKKTTAFSGRLAALRALEKALVEVSPDGVPRVEHTDPHVLHHAIQLIMRKAPGSAYQIATQLKGIADLLTENRLTFVPFSWRNPVRKPEDHLNRVGTEGAEKRRQKLPSRESLDALAAAYNMAVDPRDVIITSIGALLMCSPDRINEVFRLPVNCEDESPYDGEIRYTLRWWPSKGADAMRKPIVTPMVETAKDAIRRLRAQTEEARRMALWYENHEGQLYLPKGLEHLRALEWVDTDTLCGLLGCKAPRAVCRWAKGFGLESIVEDRPRHGTGRPGYMYRFRDIEKAVLSLLPDGFPVYDRETGLKYGESLIVVPMNFFHPDRMTYRCMFEPITTDTFNNQLGSGTDHGKTSVFSRLGLLDEEGKPFRIRSHQFRHYLNTLAKIKGLDDTTIALWSGRKDKGQTAYYDNRTNDEILARLKQGDTSELSGMTVEVPRHLPVTREQFMELQFETVHTTQYGFCTHNWTILPCQRLRACLDCTEHVCIKGDAVKTERIRNFLREAEEQLERDIKAQADGWVYADRWFELNSKRVKRLQNLMQIFDDPTVPENTVVQLTNADEYSFIALAVNERELLGDEDAQMLRRIRALRDTNSGAAQPQGGTYG